jgi:hypothetical protein
LTQRRVDEGALVMRGMAAIRAERDAAGRLP